MGVRSLGAFTALLLTLCPLAAPADPRPATASARDTALDHYLAGLQTLRVSFTQTLNDGHEHESQSGHGTLIVVRPGRFRWQMQSVDSAAGELLVADGKNLWFYDRDLAQVTVKPANSALSATPALLLSGTGDIRESFAVVSLPARGGLEWVSVRPLGAEADFREARIGFSHGELTRMELADKLGQTATLTFERAVRNGPVQPAETSFTVPPGVDLIGTPLR